MRSRHFGYFQPALVLNARKARSLRQPGERRHSGDRLRSVPFIGPNRIGPNRDRCSQKRGAGVVHLILDEPDHRLDVPQRLERLVIDDPVCAADERESGDRDKVFVPAGEEGMENAEAGTGAILKDLHELLLRLEERSNPATDTTHYGNSRISATSFYQHYARHIGAAVQDAFGVEMLRVEACLGQAWLKRQRVLRDPGLIDDPRPPPKRREPSA